MCLQSSITVSLPNCSIPKCGQPPAPSPAGIPGPRGTHRRPIRGAESELESREPVQPPAGTVRVLAAFAASLYRGGESCQWGGALETTSCWKILSVPGLKKTAVSQGPHSQQGLPPGCCCCWPQPPFRGSGFQKGMKRVPLTRNGCP